MDARKHGAKKGVYLRAADVTRPVTMTATGAAQAQIDGEDRLTIGFAESGRRLVLNSGNCELLIAAWGPETDAWEGRPVTLYTVDTTYQGRAVKGIRVRPEPPTAALAPKSDPFPASSGGGDAPF